MPAPAITITPPIGPFIYTVAPVDTRHFRIAATLTQTTSTSDWSGSINHSIIGGEAPLIPVEDRSSTSSRTFVVPFNEAPSLVLMTAKLQAMFDEVFDVLIPSP